MNTDLNIVDKVYGMTLCDQSWSRNDSLNIVVSRDRMMREGKSLSV